MWRQTKLTVRRKNNNSYRCIYLCYLHAVGKIKFFRIDFIFWDFTCMINMHRGHLKQKILEYIGNTITSRIQKIKLICRDKKVQQSSIHTHQRLCSMLLQKFDHVIVFIIYSISKGLFERHETNNQSSNSIYKSSNLFSNAVHNYRRLRNSCCREEKQEAER